MAATALLRAHLPTPAQWREVALPKEHGSWSLALEPIALGLLAAPSAAGGWLALAILAGFFARRPLRIVWRERPSPRRAAALTALLGCGSIALVAVLPALRSGGLPWLVWLLPSALLGGYFLFRDVHNGGREAGAEVAGAAAFALLPAAFAILTDASPASAVALSVAMCGRAVPTVLCVRAALRGEKTGVRRDLPALFAAFGAFAAGCVFVGFAAAPGVVGFALGALALRSVALLVFPRPALRARTIGMAETAIGIAFVAVVGATWPR